jgi:hypothetical protein
MDELFSFLSVAETDCRISPTHISLYVALWKKWKDSGTRNPLSFFRRDVADLCKISGSGTFHKALKDLHAYGYIKYLPSYDRFAGSTVEFVKMIKL